ncbi:adaptor protein MecA [Eubacterium oxidoreducens]|uniref:Adapter protein MecA 1/2 n=1 Tax=Eubacterium oxidoreducens TaxID=1732 RepID=A0A1G5ZZT3_EUBOX|nr:adaptor protein MecA [Eubacterium oxidoreducens]SDB01677.1 adapter protein MecA 1/2 [Eubacterium oxidoreducens]
MKIEKISDNQIRCILTKEDLDTRQLKISELAYGSEKTNLLFRDMMEQASYEFGFDSSNIPIIVEAIPMSADKIVLLITKVEYPEELDTRFSSFSPMNEEDSFTGFDDHLSKDYPTDAEEALGLFGKMREQHQDKKNSERKEPHFTPLGQAVSNGFKTQPEPAPKAHVNIFKLFTFPNLDELVRLSRVVSNFYHGENTLYKNPVSGNYYLVVSKSDHTFDEFTKLCNILAEYGHNQKYSIATQAYFDEHFDVIIQDHALLSLSKL